MSADYFLDTNVLLYCFDPIDSRKQRIANMLVNEARGIISYQVCQEFCHVILHKLRDTVPHAALDDYLTSHVFPMVRVQTSPMLFREAIRIHHQTQYRFYDSLIVAAAIESGASILYSEDLQHGRQIGHLRIVNPFL
jgi:predicted nucleic acid-binding protein